MIALVFILGLIGLVVWAFKADAAAARRKHAEADVWLAEQRALPRAKVVLKTKSGSIYECPMFEPSVDVKPWIHGLFVFKRSSFHPAESKVEKSFRAEHYYHEAEELYIPMCEIEEIRVVKV